MKRLQASSVLSMFGLWMAISPAKFVDDIIDKRYLQLTMMLSDKASGYGLKELDAVERLHMVTCRHVAAHIALLRRDLVLQIVITPCVVSSVLNLEVLFELA
jgi:hypothetical protein